MGGRLGLKPIGLRPDRRFHELQQVVPPERLGKETSCAVPHRLFTIRSSSLRGDEYDRHTIVSFGQFVLKFQTGHAGQLYVYDQTTRFWGDF